MSKSVKSKILGGIKGGGNRRVRVREDFVPNYSYNIWGKFVRKGIQIGIELELKIISCFNETIKRVPHD